MCGVGGCRVSSAVQRTCRAGEGMEAMDESAITKTVLSGSGLSREDGDHERAWTRKSIVADKERSLRAL